MSRIANYPVAVPPKVDVTLGQGEVVVKGPLGTLSQKFGGDVEIVWRPFQLDPTIPPGGKDRRAYMLAKFGSEERIRQMHARIEPLGEAEGINFAFDAKRA